VKAAELEGGSEAEIEVGALARSAGDVGELRAVRRVGAQGGERLRDSVEVAAPDAAGEDERG
jgi:hypothetical protein